MIPELLIVHKIPADFWQELQIFPFAMSRVSQLIRLREFETMLGSKIGISFFFFFLTIYPNKMRTNYIVPSTPAVNLSSKDRIIAFF